MKSKNAVIKQRRHSKLDLESSTHAVSQRQQHALKMPNQVQQMGFTLIELLVVVLIIGILAAVALPQYQKAVEKARVAQVLSLFKSVASAADAYYIHNGQLPTDLEELDIALPPDWTEKSATKRCKISIKWCLELLPTNVNRWQMLAITQQGPSFTEKGGFHYLWHTDGRSLPLRQVLCTENYTVTPGEFCEKLLGGKFLSDAGSIRFYSFL